MAEDKLRRMADLRRSHRSQPNNRLWRHEQGTTLIRTEIWQARRYALKYSMTLERKTPVISDTFQISGSPKHEP